MSFCCAAMKHILLLVLVPALPFLVASSFADDPKKQAEPPPEKKVEPKKKYNFIGKLLEKEKLEPGTWPSALAPGQSRPRNGYRPSTTARYCWSSSRRLMRGK